MAGQGFEPWSVPPRGTMIVHYTTPPKIGDFLWAQKLLREFRTPPIPCAAIGSAERLP
jgi:hypothetical protein